jgi:hypothetical protein
MKATETEDHDKNDNYLEKKDRKGEEKTRGRNGVLFNEKLHWVNQVQKKKWVSLLPLSGLKRFASFAVACSH